MNNKKWMAILLGGIMAASLAAPCSVSAAEKTTLTFWHAMGGTNGEVLQQIRMISTHPRMRSRLKLSIREPMMIPSQN